MKDAPSMVRHGPGARAGGVVWPRLDPRWLFGAAAVFNLGVGLSLLVARPALTSWLGLDPIRGSNLVTYYLTACFVTLFGYAYARLAFDLEGHRPFILFSLIGKLSATATIIAVWRLDALPAALLALAAGDAVFSLLFIAFLRQRAGGSKG